jgi:hypothetical protein
MRKRQGGGAGSGTVRSIASSASGLALAFALAVIIGLAASCGEVKLPLAADTGPQPDPNATFTRVQNEVFTGNCVIAGCHAALGAQRGMSLKAGSAYGNIVGVPSVEMPSLNRIQPGNPDKSYMVKKLRGDADISGVRMPDGGSLSPDKVQLVIDWVRRGAPND